MALNQDAIDEVLSFLNSIEGDGYGGMASFEIARAHLLDEREKRRQSLPIESAPMDGRPILAYSTEGVSYVCWHRKGAWIFFEDFRGNRWSFEPTHWTPLLPPPEIPLAGEVFHAADDQ